ncbi:MULTISPECIES: redoxin domain-containing protein [unclassified Acetobacterium]|jgi:peroxiredoxin|uniref:redoxin domain-containing protein n=1 Tax=unclassified Acetobacterium TaxID=2638182 RepID=UPI000DBEC2E6|nr:MULTISPECIES: redoxin domain-containing protein [unclassified Acetobacterium]AWW27182.1 peroxiredoxin [Acetobacterium sp. KB-1]MDZ5724385.1 redoxin domain-containing protein [Acetobacterium sp. K1/6]
MAEIIQLGAMAPDFALQDQNGEVVTLSQLKGKKVLLSWHPLAFTSVCTDQMRSLDRNANRFEEKNTIVLGLSVDPQPSKSVWARALSLKHIRILSDFVPLGEVARDYGIFNEEHGASKRANILINETGMVIWVKKYEIRTLPDVEEVLGKM